MSEASRNPRVQSIVGSQKHKMHATTRLLARALSTKAPKPVLNTRVAALNRVRLVDTSGADQGVMSGRAAYARAQTAGLDVLQVARGGDVPVVKLLNYAELKSSKMKKTREKSKPARAPKLKQVRLSPATDTGDLQLKIRQSRQFLTNGHRVRVFMQFRRGHGKLRDNAVDTLCGIAEALVPSAGKLHKGELTMLRDSLQPPEPPAPTSQSGTGDTMGTRIHKPLEVYFDPLSKAQREKLNTTIGQ